MNQITYFNFLNKTELMGKLDTSEGRIQFKENKGALIKLEPVEKRRYIRDSFKNTDIVCIQLQNDDFIIDCDNLYSFNFMLNLLAKHNINTLVTKSPYGGHIYFKISKPLPLILQNKSIKPFDKAAIKSIQKLNYYSNCKELDIEFFSQPTRGNTPIFDGANNGYYKIHNNSDIALLTTDFLNELINLISLHTNSLNKPLGQKVNNKDFYPNEHIARYIKDIIEGKKQLTWENFIERFYNSYYKDINAMINDLGGRNNTLHIIWRWGGNCGYLDEIQLNSWVKIFKDTFIPDFDNNELYNTVLSPNRFKKYFYNAEETQELLKTLTLKKDNDFLPLLRKPIFVGRDKITYNIFYLFLFDSPNKKVIQINGLKNLQQALQNYNIMSDYCKIHRDENSSKMEIDLNKIPIITIELEGNPFEPFRLDKQGHIIVNMGYFKINPKIVEILNSQGKIPHDILEKQFKSTPFYQVIKQNLMPNKSIRYKYLGDLGNYLKNRTCKMNHYIFIRDIWGGTGKDGTLSKTLHYLIHGIPNFARQYTCLNQSKVISQTDNSFPQFFTSKIIMDRFNGGIASHNLITISEIREQDKLPVFIDNMKSFIGQDSISIEEKGKDLYSIANNKFYQVFTNREDGDLIDTNVTSNRRFYVSEALKIIDIGLYEQRLKLYKQCDFLQDIINETYYGNEFEAVYQRCEEIILRYLIEIAPYHEDYCGFNNLPEIIYDEEETNNIDCENSIKDLQGEFEFMAANQNGGRQSKYQIENLISIMWEYLLTPNNQINYKNLEFLCSKDLDKKLDGLTNAWQLRGLGLLFYNLAFGENTQAKNTGDFQSNPDYLLQCIDTNTREFRFINTNPTKTSFIKALCYYLGICYRARKRYLESTLLKKGFLIRRPGDRDIISCKNKNLIT